MDLDRSPAQISRAMAEEARALNHRTLDKKVFETPSDLAYTAVMVGLQEARQALGTVEAHLRDANRVLSNLGAPWPEDDDED